MSGKNVVTNLCVFEFLSNIFQMLTHGIGFVFIVKKNILQLGYFALLFLNLKEY